MDTRSRNSLLAREVRRMTAESFAPKSLIRRLVSLTGRKDYRSTINEISQAQRFRESKKSRKAFFRRAAEAREKRVVKREISNPKLLTTDWRQQSIRTDQKKKRSNRPLEQTNQANFERKLNNKSRKLTSINESATLLVGGLPERLESKTLPNQQMDVKISENMTRSTKVILDVNFSAESRTTCSANKEKREKRNFALNVWRSLNRAASAMLNQDITFPIIWQNPDIDHVKIAKFVFNAPLSLALDNPLPPNPVELETYLPSEILSVIREPGYAYLISQFKRVLPLLPSSEVQKSVKAHRACIEKESSTSTDLHLYWVRKIAKLVFGSLRKEKWTVKEADFSESATYGSMRSEGGGRAKLECQELVCERCASGEGKYHDRRKMWRSFLTEDIEVARVAAVNSNMKVRIITAHHPACNFFRPLQKLLWSTMKNVPVFNLTGQMPTADNLSIFRQVEGYVFNSADYSCATDGINGESSSAALDAIFDCVQKPDDLDFEEWGIFKGRAKTTLTSSLIYYGKGKKNVVQQKKGQMMGHLLSFPILCIINAAIWAETMCFNELELDDIEAIFRGQIDYPLRINGDDLLSSMLIRTVEQFARTVRANGWSLSVGKSYVHERFGIINSQMFDFKNHVQIFREMKFGGLQKGATRAAFSDWLWQSKGEKDVFLFVSFYKDWIYREFGHPLCSGYFRFFEVDTQRRLIRLFPEVNLKDFLVKQRLDRIEEKHLLEESRLAECFLQNCPAACSKLEFDQISSFQKFREFDKNFKYTQSFQQMSSLSTRMGLNILPFSETSSIPMFSEIYNRELSHSIDEIFWTFVGKYRSTRLAILEYGTSDTSARAFLNWKFKKESYRKEIFKSWKSNLKSLSLRKISRESTGRFFLHPDRYTNVLSPFDEFSLSQRQVLVDHDASVMIENSLFEGSVLDPDAPFSYFRSSHLRDRPLAFTAQSENPFAKE
nr:RNA-dependent RNA polymerase [Sclerotinia sclerotiorum ourmia-like virus 22]